MTMTTATKVSLKGRELTPREEEVLQHISKGESNKEIAQKLKISVETVKEHAQIIYRKLDVDGRVRAVLWVFKNRKEWLPK